MTSNTSNELTHVVGTFLIQAEGAFLNGAGLAPGEYGNMVEPKTFTDFRDKVPYVSSQAWKRWLRNTFQEENPDMPVAEIEAIGLSEKGTTNKIGTKMDPLLYPEDDIFGFMRAQEGQGRISLEESEELEEEMPEAKPKKKERTKSVMRSAPFVASILTSLRKSGWQGMDKAFVHLKEGTPQPYNTEFYNTQLQGIFGLDYSRLGVFRNEGDRIELDEKLVEKYLSDGTIEVEKETSAGKVYKIKTNPRKERATSILNALAIMRGGAKLAQFAVDVAPKAVVLAGLNCGNLIFNDLFEDTKEGPRLKLPMLKQVIHDYASRIITPVLIGIREGYFCPESEKELKEWVQSEELKSVEVKLLSPVAVFKHITELLP